MKEEQEVPSASLPSYSSSTPRIIKGNDRGDKSAKPNSRSRSAFISSIISGIILFL